MSDIKQHRIGCQSTESLGARACDCGLHDSPATPNTPPETEALMKSLMGRCGSFDEFCNDVEIACSKLERERDEYKQLLADTLKSDAPLVERLKLECDQLNKRVAIMVTGRAKCLQLLDKMGVKNPPGVSDGLIFVHAELEQLRRVADELRWLASLADYDSQRRDDALSSYDKLPHVIAKNSIDKPQ